jgi:hypothetical protein
MPDASLLLPRSVVISADIRRSSRQRIEPKPFKSLSLRMTRNSSSQRGPKDTEGGSTAVHRVVVQEGR